MKSKDTPSKVKEQEQSKLTNSNNKLKKLRSDYFIQIFFGYISGRKSLEILKYNKSIQKRINIDINSYKEFCEKYSSIELEVIPMKNEYGKFIDIKKDETNFFHIYFNDNKRKEIKRTSLNKNDKVSKINIIIDYQVKSFSSLFKYCKCIKSITFKKFYRNNITDMSEMFRECSSLKELNLNNFNTNNVTNMRYMFCGCSSLKKLNLNNFNTNNVTNMFGMFEVCDSLKELNLNSFNTNQVTNMNAMFSGCSSLDELNLDNFNTNNVTDMNFMFFGCSDELKLKIKSKYKIFKKQAFKK